MAKVLRSIFVEPELDARLASQAEQEALTKSELIRRYCLEGLERAARGELEIEQAAQRHADRNTTALSKKAAVATVVKRAGGKFVVREAVNPAKAVEPAKPSAATAPRAPKRF